MYHYAGNNPVRYLDPDGRIIEVDENSSETFKTDFNAALEYLNKSERARSIIEPLQKSKTVFTVKESFSVHEDSFCMDGSSIIWCALGTIVASNGEFNSPAINLMHEFCHAFFSLPQGKKIFIQLCENNGFAYDTLTAPDRDFLNEEFATLMEQDVALSLGEPSGRNLYDDLSRISGYSIEIKVLSPLSNSRRK